MAKNDDKPMTSEREFVRKARRRAERRMRFLNAPKRSPWYWVGMFGLVGWPVAVTTAIGAYIGIKLDQWRPMPFSWTLSGIFVGLIVGCITAWYWVRRESERD